VHGSNLGRNVGCPGWVSLLFSSVRQRNAGIILRLDHDRLLPNPFQIIRQPIILCCIISLRKTSFENNGIYIKFSSIHVIKCSPTAVTFAVRRSDDIMSAAGSEFTTPTLSAGTLSMGKTKRPDVLVFLLHRSIVIHLTLREELLDKLQRFSLANNRSCYMSYHARVLNSYLAPIH
jgi:hypothetical protein